MGWRSLFQYSVFLCFSIFSTSFYHKHFVQSHLNPVTHIPSHYPSRAEEYSWPDRGVRRFFWVLSYKRFGKLGVKWVCSLEGQGDTHVFASFLPFQPCNTDQLCRWNLGLSSSSYKASRGPQAHASLCLSACLCTVDYLYYQPFFL